MDQPPLGDVRQVSVIVFGHTKDGTPVKAVTISAGGVTATVMEWGATLLDLRLAGVNHSLTAGFEDFATYETHGQHVGAIAGRFAGRIAGGFEIAGNYYPTTRNNGPATLHGGGAGFGVSLWTLDTYGVDFVDMTIRQPDGAGGFPGEIEAHCRYDAADGELRLRLTATADRPTVCNLAQHSYFNLSGAATIDDHVLQLEADRYTPLNGDLLPTGDVLPCDPSRDYRAPRRIGAASLDGHFVLADTRRDLPARAAVLRGGDVEMTVETTEPGLVVYTADKFPVTSGGLASGPYGPRAGICLEGQVWPDAPNQPGFPTADLMPGDTYFQETKCQLKKVSG